MKAEEVVTRFFEEYNLTWKIDGDNYIPTQKDVEIFFDHAVSHLKSEPVGARLTVGQLIFEKVDEEFYDCYVYAGTFK